MSARQSTGAGPGIGDRVSLTHEASGSVLHGTVQLCPTVGLVVDVDGRVFDMDRSGWHVSQADVEPPMDSIVVVDVAMLGPLAAQRMTGGWWLAASETPRTWAQLREYGPLELVWEPSC